jgi:hypothetical protein
MQLFGDGNEGSQQARLELVLGLHTRFISQSTQLVLADINKKPHVGVVSHQQEVSN